MCLSKRLKYLKRALRNAKARALYWSGNPSFTGKRFNPSRSRYSHAEQYELALCDIDSLSHEIESITGKPVKRSDPKAEFNAKFLALLDKLPKKS